MITYSDETQICKFTSTNRFKPGIPSNNTVKCPKFHFPMNN